MIRITSFPPISAPHARVLILGSMPGAASLRAGQYYAHPHNRFWPIMAALLGFDPALPYTTRCAHLTAAGIAVWDVLQSCVRPGSLDSAIDRASSISNDFATFFATHPQIQRVVFNGTTAEACFLRHVRPQLSLDKVELVRLPSTSPAHAGMRPEAKLAAWSAALDGLLQGPS